MLTRRGMVAAGLVVIVVSASSALAEPLPGTIVEFGVGYTPSNYGTDRSGAPVGSAFVVVPIEGRVALQCGMVGLHHKSIDDPTFVGIAVGVRYYITRGGTGGIFLEASPSAFVGHWASTHLMPGFEEGGGITVRLSSNVFVELGALYILTADHTERFADGSLVLEGLNHGVLSVRLGMRL